MAFRVGVVGHRPNRLASADMSLLGERIRSILKAVREEVAAHHRSHREFYNDADLCLRALSPLAEGVDRLFVDQALTEGFKVCAVLPFPRAEFELDFEPSHELEPKSVHRFKMLLGQATTVFELDGHRSDESRAYHVAGDVVLNQSDLLIVVWDGERKNLRGGTEQTFDDAVERGVPVVWIDAHAPHHWRIVTQPIRLLDGIKPGVRAALVKSADLAIVSQHVARLLDLPQVAPSTSHDADAKEDQRAMLRTFLSESRPDRNAIWWKWFRNIVGDWKIWPPSMLSKPYEEDENILKEWPRDRSHAVASAIDTLRPYYAWPDKLADRYADAYRSAFVVAFGLAAFAVAMALGSIGLHLAPHGIGELLFAGLELLAIGLILFIVFRGRHRQWHRRWLDYRLLAEMVRHLRLVAHLGSQRATPLAPEHLTSYGDPGISWMAWYARAVERSLGLPSAVIDRDFLTHSLDDVIRLLEGQIRFHQTTFERCERIEHRLHLAEVTLLVLTLVCCAQHMMQGLLHDWPQLPGHLLTFFCGVFPAMGAALAGINNQGEFRRLARRSRSMHARLSQHLLELQVSQSRMTTGATIGQLSADISHTAANAARAMINEILDWRVIFQDRPLRTT